VTGGALSAKLESNPAPAADAAYEQQAPADRGGAENEGETK